MGIKVVTNCRAKCFDCEFDSDGHDCEANAILAAGEHLEGFDETRQEFRSGHTVEITKKITVENHW